jgi:HEAT repeat protein
MRRPFATLFLLAITSPLAAQARPAAHHTAAAAGQAAADTMFENRPLSAWIADLKAAAPATRNHAAYAIAGMGPAAASAVPALIATLSDPASSVRYPAAYALGEIGPAAESAIPALLKLVDDPNEEVGFIARKSLKKLGHPVPIPSDD